MMSQERGSLAVLLIFRVFRSGASLALASCLESDIRLNFHGRLAGAWGLAR